MDSARRRTGVLFAIWLAAIALGLPARALAVTSNGGSRILGVPSGRCLDVIGGATQPGTRVQLWNCLGDPQQAWTWSHELGGSLSWPRVPPACADVGPRP